MYTIILIILIIIGIKLGVKLVKEKDALVSQGVEISSIVFILIFLILALVPIFALAIPLKEIRFLITPYPIGIILFIPLIYLTYKYSKMLECKGVDIAERLSRNISGIMWYGIGGLVILISSWSFGSFMSTSWLHHNF